MFEMLQSVLSSTLFSALLDLLLMVVVVSAWVLWWKQSKRSARIEVGLLEAAAQLQEATQLLDDALNQIALLKKREESTSPQTEKEVASQPIAASHASSESEFDEDDFGQGVNVDFSSRSRDLLNAQRDRLLAKPAKTPREQPVKQARKQSASDIAQILRMQREGASLDNIASTLDIPLAQVKLMLMLQKGAS